MLFTLISRPITAQALAAEGALIGVGGAAGVTVSWPILAVALLICAVGLAVGLNAEEIKAKAIELYESSTLVSSWADYAGPRIQEGTVIVTIGPDLQRYIQKKYNGNKVPDNFPILYIPNTFTSLDALTQAELLGVDTGGLLQAGNELITENNSLISTGNGILGNIQTAISNGIEGVKTKLSLFYTQVGEALTTINNNMLSRLDGLKTTINETKSALANRLDGIKNGVLSLKTEVQTAISEATSSIAYRVEAVSATISGFKESVVFRVEGILNKVQTLPADIAGAFESFFTSLELKIESLTGAISPNPLPGNTDEDTLDNAKPGSDKTMIYIGKGKDLISKYSVAFLAVGATLTKFIDLPVVGDLIQFSLALGIFALVVNLANQIISAEDKKGAKSYKARSAKGG